MKYQQNKSAVKRITLKDLIRAVSAHVKDENGVDTGKLIAIYTDHEMIKIVKERLGIEYSERAIAQSRSRQGIERCISNGGARKGAGRPRGSENKHSNSQPTARLTHNQSIGTAALVQACMSSYTCEYENGDVFDYCKNAYAKHREVWKYTGSATRPYDLPSRYSPAPMALMGRSGKVFKSSLSDIQKQQCAKGM